MHRIINFVFKHSKLVLIVIAIITAVFAYNAKDIHINGKYSDLFVEDPAITKLKEQYTTKVDSVYNHEFYFMVSSDNIYTPEILNKLDKVLLELDQYEEIGPCTSVFSIPTIVKKDTRLAISTTTKHEQGTPWSEEEIASFKELVLNDDVINGLLATDNGNTLLFFFNVKTFTDDFTLKVNSIVETLSPYVNKVSYGGTGTFALSMQRYLYSDLVKLLLLVFLVILIIFFISFRSFRAIFITLTLSLIGLIWTVGTMVILGYELTLATIITPCMVLILGSSYSVHYLNEYFKSYHKGDNNSQLKNSFSKISKTIFMACITTIISFLSLLVCEMISFRQMGISVAIGILYCALLSITLIPAFLNLLKPPRKIQMDQYKSGLFTKIENSIPKFVTKHYKFAILIFILLVGGFLYSYNKIETETNYMEYFPQDDPMIIGFKNLAINFGSTIPYYIILKAPEGAKNYFKDSTHLKEVFALESALLRDDKDIQHITSVSQYVAFMNKVYSGERVIPDSNGLINMLSRYLVVIQNSQDTGNFFSDLLSKDGNTMKLQINYYDSEKMNQPSIQCAQRLSNSLANNRTLLNENVKIVSWSEASEGLHLTQIMQSDQKKSTIISFILVFIFVTILFKSLSEGLYSMIPVTTGILGNYIFMYLANIPFDIVTSIFATIVVGVGIDDAIHFMIRYNNYRKIDKNLPINTIITDTLVETIRPITLTSISIIGGMLIMLFASYSPIRYFGILLAFALILTTISTLILLPSAIIFVEKIKSKFKK
ncbi:MAG: MMPL family transporter [Spirochaetaceae bacterium]|nr:MMPL family transporter [Spirochaetaceae bacterium]